jgi:hypothetical protein
MTATLLWDAGPGEIRAGLIEHGALTEFRIIRPRRQEALLAAGEIYTARVLQVLGRGRALVSLGETQEALCERASGLTKGILVPVQMRRGPIPEPGRWKLPIVYPLADVAPRADAGWHFSAEPWEPFLRDMAGRVSAIACPDAQTVLEVQDIIGTTDVAVRADADTIADADFGGLIDQAVIGEYPITNGMLTIERTRAMVMIDIDGDDAPHMLNRAAAEAIPPLLRLLNIGGPVGVDFLTMQDRAQRQEIDQRLDAACRTLGGYERTAINGFGFAQIIRPRTSASIPELLCGTTPGRLSLESRAIALLREAGRSVGHGPRHLIAQPAVIDLIHSWPEETKALRSALGVEIVFVPDAAATGYGHVHVSPP